MGSTPQGGANRGAVPTTWVHDSPSDDDPTGGATAVLLAGMQGLAATSGGAAAPVRSARVHGPVRLQYLLEPMPAALVVLAPQGSSRYTVTACRLGRALGGWSSSPAGRPFPWRAYDT